MSGLRTDIIAALCRPAEAAFAKFARGAASTRHEARLAMAMAIIADTPEADLPALKHSIEMMIASRPEGEQRTRASIRDRH